VHDREHKQVYFAKITYASAGLTFSTDEAESVATMDKRHGRVPPLRMQVQELIQVSPC
jgi:hypothetical protein